MIDQLVIAVGGPAAVLLSQCRRPSTQRWGCVVATLTQPFWFYTTIVHQQWGVFAASLVYTVVWLLGVWNYWLRDRFKGVACGDVVPT